MNILLTADGYPTKDYLGEGIFTFDQGKALSALGNNVYMVVADVRSIRRKRSWGYVHETIEGVNIHAYNFPLGRVPNFIIDFVRILIFRFLYKKITKKGITIDVIHAHFGLAAGYPTMKALKSTGIPIVITEHGSNVHVGVISSKILSKLKYTYTNAVKVFAVSHSLAKRIKELTQVSALVVPNIVDVSIFMPETKPHAGFNVMSVCSLTEAKGVGLLISSFAKVFKISSVEKLYICGVGAKKNYYQELIEELGIQNQIFLLGQKPRTEIAELMKECDGFVLPSQTETFGVAYIEALAAGLPVVATKCGGPEDFITEKNGLLIPIDDANALEKALLYMKVHHANYNKKELSEEVKIKYSAHTIANQLMGFYRGIISK